MSAGLKRCVVAYATPGHQHLWDLDLAPAASVGDALQAARERARVEGVGADIPWDTAPVGIFGEPCNRSWVPRDGDRIEIYRPLAGDPRERRRLRSKQRPPR